MKKMNLDKFSTFIYIITFFASNVIQAKNSCLKEWYDMKAYNAIGKHFIKKSYTFYVLKSTYIGKVYYNKTLEF